MVARAKVTPRYYTNAVSTANITAQNLLDIYLIHAANATTGVRLFESIRLKRVRIWAVSITSNVPVTIEMEWISNNLNSGGPSRPMTDTSLGSATPAHLDLVPPAGSTADLWQDLGSNAILFSVNLPTNALIDVELDGVIANGNTGTSSQNAIVTGTVGTIYMRGLDGLAVVASNYTVVPGSYTQV